MMLAMAPQDIGLSFTGSSLADTSHLTMSLDAPMGGGDFYGGGGVGGEGGVGGSGNGGGGWEMNYALEGTPQGFFSDVVFGAGAH